MPQDGLFIPFSYYTAYLMPFATQASPYLYLSSTCGPNSVS
jgi:hypothetical protein